MKIQGKTRILKVQKPILMDFSAIFFGVLFVLFTIGHLIFWPLVMVLFWGGVFSIFRR